MYLALAMFFVLLRHEVRVKRVRRGVGVGKHCEPCVALDSFRPSAIDWSLIHSTIFRNNPLSIKITVVMNYRLVAATPTRPQDITLLYDPV